MSIQGDGVWFWIRLDWIKGNCWTLAEVCPLLSAILVETAAIVLPIALRICWMQRGNFYLHQYVVLWLWVTIKTLLLRNQGTVDAASLSIQTDTRRRKWFEAVRLKNFSQQRENGVTQVRISSHSTDLNRLSSENTYHKLEKQHGRYLCISLVWQDCAHILFRSLNVGYMVL